MAETKEPEKFREPLPPKYLENILKAGTANPETSVRLWVDSTLLTEKQLSYLSDSIKHSTAANVSLQDLRSIPDFQKESLFNQAHRESNWRDTEKNAVIWRQVDAAKILISLQGNFDQVFYADLDYANIPVDSKPIQNLLKNHGVLFRGFVQNDKVGPSDKVGFENQLWGFEQRRKPFFESLYRRTLKSAHNNQIGYRDFVAHIQTELVEQEGINPKEIYYVGNHDGSNAWHPGHPWSHGNELPSHHSHFKRKENALIDFKLVSHYIRKGADFDLWEKLKPVRQDLIAKLSLGVLNKE